MESPISYHKVFGLILWLWQPFSRVGVLYWLLNPSFPISNPISIFTFSFPISIYIYYVVPYYFLALSLINITPFSIVYLPNFKHPHVQSLCNFLNNNNSSICDFWQFSYDHPSSLQLIIQYLINLIFIYLIFCLCIYCLY